LWAATPDERDVATTRVECLKCGAEHSLTRVPGGHLQQGECPRCGYLGWAPVADMTEALRAVVRTTAFSAADARLAG
jgi:hypothetical protein